MNIINSKKNFVFIFLFVHILLLEDHCICNGLLCFFRHILLIILFIKRGGILLHFFITPNIYFKKILEVINLKTKKKGKSEVDRINYFTIQ